MESAKLHSNAFQIPDSERMTFGIGNEAFGKAGASAVIRQAKTAFIP